MIDETTVVKAFFASPAPHVVSRHRRIQWCNAAFASLFGHEPEALWNTSLAPLYPSADDFARIGRQGLERMRKAPQYEDERMMKHRDGTVFWCRVRGMSLSPSDPFALAVWNFEKMHARVPGGAGLTPREREVVALIGAGRTSKEIGRSLGLSHRTVESHRLSAMRRLGARNVAELVAQVATPA